MNYYLFVIIVIIRSMAIDAMEIKQGSTEKSGCDLIVSDSLDSLLKKHPSENTGLLNNIAATNLKIQNHEDNILEKIKQSASKNSVSSAILAMEESYACTVNSSHGVTLFLSLEKVIERLNIQFDANLLPIETKEVALLLIKAISKYGIIGESYEYLFMTPSRQYWTSKNTLKKENKWINPKVRLELRSDVYYKIIF